MKKSDYYKQEMIKRYSYLYENASFIFSYFMRRETKDEYSKYIELTKKPCSMDDYFNMDLNLIDPYNLYMLESVILEDKPLEKTMGYMHFEVLHNNLDNILKARYGLMLKDEYNSKHKHKLLEFNVLELLNDIYENVARQNNNIENKEKKLRILDEYIRIAKYTNDDKVWTGGYFLSGADHISNNPEFKLKYNGINQLPTRLPYDIGIPNNELIEVSMNITFSEVDKKQLYHKYHEEIPYDLEIKCNQNGIYEIDRPQYSKPCNYSLRLKKQHIFSLERDEDYVFLTLCPYCSYIIGVQSDLIPSSIQEDIIWNNKKDPSIYEESYLQSEIRSLKRVKNKSKY